MKKYIALIFCLSLTITIFAETDEIFDISKISSGKFIFTVPHIKPDCKNSEKILLTSIEISVDNTVNSRTTRTCNSQFPYRYKYLYILNDLSLDIMEKESYKIIFDPMHPDSIKDGELKGYTLYPDIDIMKEYNDVLEMVEILKLINNIKQNYQADCGN